MSSNLDFDNEPSPSQLESKDDDEETIITSIRATDVALGLRRLPASFYTAVHHSGLMWRTESKCALVNQDLVEWTDPIPIPSALSSVVRLEVYGSFEFRPTLGAGEQLRKLTVTVEELLDRSTRDAPFALFPKDGDIVSPCSSISITVKRQKRESGDPSALLPHCSTTEFGGELEDATNRGYIALLRYRKRGERLDLEHSIAQFSRALRICPLSHPCHAVTQSNLAMAKFFLCQVEDNDAFCNDSLHLYGNALGTRPTGHVDRPSTLIQLAIVHLTRFEKRKDEVDRERGEALLHEAIELSHADSHENQAAAFILQLHARHGADPARHWDSANEFIGEQEASSPQTDEEMEIFAAQLFARFGLSSDLADLERAVAFLRQWAKSASFSDDRLGYYAGLIRDIGSVLFHRFEQLGELSDLECAIVSLRAAAELTPRDDPDKAIRFNDVGKSLSTRFKHLGDLGNLEDALSAFKTAVGLAPHDHPDKFRLLSNLGGTLMTRFERLGELCDLEDAISSRKAVIDFTPHGHPDRGLYLANLGGSLTLRVMRLGELSDLEDAISTQKAAVDLMPRGHSAILGCLNNLGICFLSRFERFGELSDLEEAISSHKAAVNLTPHGHPQKAIRLMSCGRSFMARFDRLGEINDVEDAISSQKAAVDLIPHGHPAKADCLNDLGISFSARFERLRDLSDLEGALSAFKAAASLTSHDHPNKLTYLNNLGATLTARFKFKSVGDLCDLEDSLSAYKTAVDLAPYGHPKKGAFLNRLSNSHFVRFEQLGKLSDLDEAISNCKAAIDLTSHGDTDKPTYLDSLGVSLLTRFERLGEVSDLEEAIYSHKVAIDLVPHGHPNKHAFMGNLGNCFGTRFTCLGELKDLEDAISHHRASIDLTPHGHPDKGQSLSNLGESLFVRFERLGELSDLEDAISTQKAALDLMPQDHPAMSSCLNNLGNSFLARFDRLRDPSDLGDALSAHKSAVDLTPCGHPNRPSQLSSLGNSFFWRFKRLGELSDLEDAIANYKIANDLTPDSHHGKPACHNNLGSSLTTRFEHLGELRDLEDAILNYKAAVTLIPHGHPGKPGCLSNLGNSFFSRFERLGDLGDLDIAISAQKAAVDITPDGHPQKAGFLSTLGHSFRVRFERLGKQNDLEVSISLYFHAAASPFSPIVTRFDAVKEWISCARLTHHDSLIHAYSTAVDLLPELAWIGLPLSHRYSRLSRGAHLIGDAAAAALDSGSPETAVEWLEQGRSIVWGELFQLRNSYEELSLSHPDHARRLRELSAALEYASATRDQSLSKLSDGAQNASHRGSESLQQEVDRHRKLAIERDKLLQEIRRFKGFERFLLQKKFSQLRASAHSGPVVILNAAESRCDALIILANVDHVIHVPLPKFNFKRSSGLQNMLEKLLGHSRDTRIDEREGKSATLGAVSWESLLTTLWKEVVKPILDALAFSSPGDLSRIFWCPTGPFTFLPLHAAGLYGVQQSQPGHKVSDFVVSSYVPNLSILAQSPNSTVPSDNFSLLVVRQPPTDGLSRLPGVVTELELIKATARESRTALVESSAGTVEEVTYLMKEADWVHFACHGIQDGVESGLCLADERRLKLRDIIALSRRRRGGLAFLSACQTAMGEEGLADEAIHVAAGMLFAGFGGVIGTMWSISDKLAPRVARDVYGQLFRNGTRPDHQDAARALHEAIGRLRESGKASFVTWLPFIHVGL